MDYYKIKYELEKRNIPIKHFCSRIGITEQGLHQMIRKGSMKIELLEKISEELKLPMSFWFQETAHHPSLKHQHFNETEISLPIEQKKTPSFKSIDQLTTDLNKVLKSLANQE